jgi:hypothetical protein
VGKTALALRTAHQLADHFPDGQLYVNLGATGERPADPYFVLEDFLRSFGFDESALPLTLGQRTGLWRSLLARRKVLIVLDDAQDSAQIQALLPGGAGSSAIITSWRRMPGLTNEVRWMTLRPLPPWDGVKMLAEVAGAERVAREPRRAAELVILCGNVPLAIRIAGERLLARPNWTIAHLVSQMRKDMSRAVVGHTDCDNVDAALRAIESRLPPEQVHVFRLGAIPFWSEFDASSAAVLFDVGEDEAGNLLEALVDAHLLETTAGGLYRYLPPVKAFARRQAATALGEKQRRAALHRLSRKSLRAQ